MGTLSEEALQGIAAYEYKSGAYTWLDYKLTPFWNLSVNLLPIWMAPNLVTLIGTLLIVLSTGIIGYYSPTLDVDAPSWVYAFAAICLFLYQTLDAIDGKQARRTGTSSPLGQLFDHGCDAMCVTLNAVGSASALGIGPTFECGLSVAFCCIAFYFAQWEEYHTGTLSCGNGIYGVTEAQMSLIGIYIVTAIYGTSVWHVPLTSAFNIDWNGCNLFLAAFFFSSGSLILTNVTTVLTMKESVLTPRELGNKQTSRGLAALQILPGLAVLIMACLWITSPSDKTDFATYPLVYIIPIGISITLLSTRLVVCHMCKVPVTWQCRVLVPLMLLLLNSYGPSLGLLSSYVIHPFAAALLYALYILITYLFYLIGVVFDICDYLNVSLLTIPVKRA